MKLKIKKLHPDAVIPHFATEGAAGLDLTAVRVYGSACANDAPVKGQPFIRCETSLSFEIPKGYVGLLFPRSSVVKTGLSMGNCVGVIDSDYRGEVSAVFYSPLNSDPYRPGDRCCQLVIVKLPEIEIEEVDELSETARGEGGYGSTGR